MTEMSQRKKQGSSRLLVTLPKGVQTEYNKRNWTKKKFANSIVSISSG